MFAFGRGRVTTTGFNHNINTATGLRKRVRRSPQGYVLDLEDDQVTVFGAARGRRLWRRFGFEQSGCLSGVRAGAGRVLERRARFGVRVTAAGDGVRRIRQRLAGLIVRISGGSGRYLWQRCRDDAVVR